MLVSAIPGVPMGVLLYIITGVPDSPLYMIAELGGGMMGDTPLRPPARNKDDHPATWTML